MLKYKRKQENIMDKNIIAIVDESVLHKDGTRYILIDDNTGEVIDTAQGYGFKTSKKAYASYYYKQIKDNTYGISFNKINEAKKWLSNNPQFLINLNSYAFDILETNKNAYYFEDIINEKLVDKVLKNINKKNFIFC